MTEKTQAYWNISLDCYCPKCEGYVNLLDDCDFWDGRYFDVCEHHTDRTRGVEVICPDCGHEFEVDFDY